MILLSLFVIFVTLIYGYNKYKHSYWRKKGVVGPKPTPFVGNLGEAMLMKKNIAIIYDEIYKKYIDEPFVGLYLQYKPAILVRDPELIKTILGKDFQSFHKNDFDIDEGVDPIFSITPFAASGERWKRSRNQMTPGFTGGRMKKMFGQIVLICDRLKSYIESNNDAKSEEGILVNELCTKLSTEVIALSAFGLEAEAFTNPKSQFREKLQNLVSASIWNNLKHAVNNTFPFLKGFIKIRFFNKEASDWMVNVVSEAVKYRQQNNIQRDDFLNYLIQLKNKEGYDFTDKEIAACSVTFVSGGIDSSSVTLAYALYEVASDPDIQNRLREEVKKVINKHNGEFSYEAIIDMQYLDQVINETIRKYPGFLIIFKRCTQAMYFPRQNKKSEGVLIDPGTCIALPIYSIQRDPAHYHNPEKFDPERYSEEQKQNINKHTLLTFGGGPRQCLGMIFAVTLVKAALAHTVLNFKLKVTSKTIQPLQLNKRTVLHEPEGGIWLNIEKI